ncbi:MAG: chromate transporter [Syntrophobacteraceae bacterium]|jgi:chromate transport protein ChrA
MITYLRKMVVSERKWLDGESFQNGAALCQIVPGATVMQMAAYIGLRVRGVAGAAVSLTGFGLLVTVTIRFGLNVHRDAAHLILCTAAFATGIEV